jgi:hypothetical protein
VPSRIFSAQRAASPARACFADPAGHETGICLGGATIPAGTSFGWLAGMGHVPSPSFLSIKGTRDWKTIQAWSRTPP